MDLMNYLPPVYENNETMIELQHILSSKINLLATDRDKIINECFIGTASNLLSRYEKLYGLTVDITKSDTFRRERLKARAKGTGTVTKQMLENVAASYSNGEVEVIENIEDYSFVVKFVGTKGIPANMADLTLTIEEIKPAHLSFTFVYTYSTWNDVSNMTWDGVAAYTWDEFRVR